MKNNSIYLILFSLFMLPLGLMAQVTVNSSGQLKIDGSTGGARLQIETTTGNGYMGFYDDGVLEGWVQSFSDNMDITSATGELWLRTTTSGGDVRVITGGAFNVETNLIELNDPLSKYIRFYDGGTQIGFISALAANMQIQATNGGGIYVNSNDRINFLTGPTTSLAGTFTSDGDFGVGTSAPASKVHFVVGGDDPIIEGNIPFLQIRGETAAQNKGIIFQNGTSSQSYVYHNGANDNLVLFNSGPADFNLTAAGNVGIGTSSPAYKLQVAGNVDVTGELTAASDMRLKKDITPISTAMDVLNALNPVSYNFDCATFPDLELAERRKYGLLAQEVEAVLPNLVSDGAEVSNINGETIHVKSVNYMEMIPLLIRSVQELEDRLDASEELIKQQSDEIEVLKKSIQNQQ